MSNRVHSSVQGQAEVGKGRLREQRSDVGRGQHGSRERDVPAACQAVRCEVKARGAVITVGELHAHVDLEVGKGSVGDAATACSRLADDVERVRKPRNGSINTLLLHELSIASKRVDSAVEDRVLIILAAMHRPVPVRRGTGIGALITESRLELPDDVPVPGQEPSLRTAKLVRELQDDILGWRRNGDKH